MTDFNRDRKELYRELTTIVDAAITQGRLSMESLARNAEACFQRHRLRGPQFNNVRKVLVTRMDGLGDLVMTSPFLRELRYNLPTAHISLLVRTGNREAVEACPYCNQVLTFDSIPTFKRFPTRGYIQSLLDFAYDNLWVDSYDVCLVPRFDIDEFYDGFACIVSVARRRYGFQEGVTPWKQQLNQGYDAIFSKVVPDMGFTHEVERSLSMIRYLGGTVRSSKTEVWTKVQEEVWAEEVLAGVPRPVAAVSIGQVDDRRYWPVERYAELLRWLGTEYGWSFVLLGNREEQEPATRLANGENVPRMINLTGHTTVRQMMAVLRRCKVYLGRDTGTKHLAAAAGVPVVEISCHSRQVPAIAIPSPSRYGAWGVPNLVIQPEKALPPCQLVCSRQESHCILQISVEQVRQALVQFMHRIGVTNR